MADNGSQPTLYHRYKIIVFNYMTTDFNIDPVYNKSILKSKFTQMKEKNV